MDSPTMKDALALLPSLTEQEVEELDMLLAAVPTPLTVIWQVIRPDRSVAGYLLATKDGPIELDPDDPLLKDYPPATPEA